MLCVCNVSGGKIVVSMVVRMAAVRSLMAAMMRPSLVG